MDRPRDIQNLAKLILPNIEYRTSDLVLYCVRLEYQGVDTINVDSKHHVID